MDSPIGVGVDGDVGDADSFVLISVLPVWFGVGDVEADIIVVVVVVGSGDGRRCGGEE